MRIFTLAIYSALTGCLPSASPALHEEVRMYGGQGPNIMESHDVGTYHGELIPGGTYFVCVDDEQARNILCDATLPGMSWDETCTAFLKGFNGAPGITGAVHCYRQYEAACFTYNQFGLPGHQYSCSNRPSACFHFAAYMREHTSDFDDVSACYSVRLGN